MKRLQLGALLLFLAAVSPLFLWYGRRITDQSDEPLGLIALLTALGFLWLQRKEISVQPLALAGGALLLISAQLSPLKQFPLGLGLVVIVALGLALQVPRKKAGIMLLLFLSLPLMASLNFFAGYPLRLIVAESSRILLFLGGLDIERVGALLKDGAQLVGVDPPCAGISMLWTGCFAAAVLATRLSFSYFQTAKFLCGSLLLVILGNVLRATILFFPESGRVHWPHFTHEGVGLIMHAFVLLVIVALSGRFSGKFSKRPAQTWTFTHVLKTSAIWASLGFLLAGGLYFPVNRTVIAQTSLENVPIWPATFEGVPLVKMPLTEREMRFARDFPGEIARFQCEKKVVILRRVAKATRLLHASADCLKASGWSLEPQPVQKDDAGRVWSTMRGDFAGETFTVKERITNFAQSEGYTDVSAWFWAALFRSSEGPWLATTLIEPARVE